MVIACSSHTLDVLFGQQVVVSLWLNCVSNTDFSYIVGMNLLQVTASTSSEGEDGDHDHLKNDSRSSWQVLYCGNSTPLIKELKGISAHLGVDQPPIFAKK